MVSVDVPRDIPMGQSIHIGSPFMILSESPEGCHFPNIWEKDPIIPIKETKILPLKLTILFYSSPSVLKMLRDMLSPVNSSF